MKNDGIQRIVEEVEYRRARRVWMASMHARLTVTHGFHRAEKGRCLAGETIEEGTLWMRSESIPLPLSPTCLVIADVLVRRRPTPLTAVQIEHIIASDPFYSRLGANAALAGKCSVKPTTKTIKMHISRLRHQIQRALKRFGIIMRPEEVIVSEETDLLNVKAYRLAIPCEFVHLVERGGGCSHANDCVRDRCDAAAITPLAAEDGAVKMGADRKTPYHRNKTLMYPATPLRGCREDLQNNRSVRGG